MKTGKMLVILVMAIGLVGSAWANLPAGWSERTIDSDFPDWGGSVSYSSGTFTISGPSSGSHYVYTSLLGDGKITARVVGAPIVCYVQIRENLGIFSRRASIIVGLGSEGGFFASNRMYFSATGSNIGGDIFETNLPYWVRLERTGDLFTGYRSSSGNPGSWVAMGSAQISMGEETYIGMAVGSAALFEDVSCVFDNVTVTGDGGPEPGGPDNDWTVFGSNMFSNPTGNIGVGTQNPRAKLDVVGRIRISKSSGAALVELGEGLDYAEGFNLSYEKKVEPGSVVIIDPANPGKLAMSDRAYDRKVAGIVAGANGLGSGVRLGVGQFDCSVALAGRVYCNVDATEVGVQPGDLLTTSERPGYAMKAVDYGRAQGAILGKAMQKLEKGKKGQILVLVTLQ